MITFQIYMKIRWHRLGGISQKENFYHNYFVSHTYIYIYIYIPFFHVLEKWNAYEKAMEGLHKPSVHELNNGVI
jgi:hypothetical protein